MQCETLSSSSILKNWTLQLRRCSRRLMFNLKYVMSQSSDQSVFRIVAILQNLDPGIEISNSQWALIIWSSCGKKMRDEKNWEHLDIPG